MLSNYLKIALRTLLRNKVYSFINIAGLAVGMAFAILIGLWVRYELSYDSFHKNGDRIAMIRKHNLFNHEKTTKIAVSLPVYDEIKTNYPEIKHVTRADWGNFHGLKVGESKFSKQGHFVDPDFLKMFDYPLIQGSIETVLKNPRSIVLTESAAKAMFKNADPIGKIVRVDNQHDMLVTGILKDIPKNSSLDFEFLMPFEFSIQSNEFYKSQRTNWRNNFLMVMVEVREGASMEAFSAKITNLIKIKTQNKKLGTLFAFPLNKWHLHNDFKDWINVGGRIDDVRLFGLIGLFVLFIACINFMNLSTARSEKRAREVGVRKAIGSQRKQLIWQFLCESLLVTFIAFIMSLVLIQLVLPLLNDFGFQHISFDFDNSSLILAAFGVCIITGFLAGSYPAFYLSSYSVVNVLKGALTQGNKGSSPRKILVVTQFTFSIALIIGTIIIFKQIQYAKNRPLGYDPNNIISLGMTSDLLKNYQTLRQDLLNTNMVEAVCKSSSPPTAIWNQWDSFSWPGKDPNVVQIFSVIQTDFDYQKTLGMKMKAGRGFSREFATDSSAAIINEATLKIIGFKNPIGETIVLSDGDQDKKLRIIGVSENVVSQNPFSVVEPSITFFSADASGDISLRLKENVDVRKALKSIKTITNKYNPAYNFEYNFVDEEFGKKFKAEDQIGALAGIFSGLAIFISCLGLFGLAAYMAEQRTKEIGIRKVLGASILSLWTLLSKDFIKLVLLSCLIATPLAYWFMDSWLQKYSYHIEMGWWIFILASVSAVFITLVTVSYQAISAAMANPVKSLRTE